MCRVYQIPTWLPIAEALPTVVLLAEMNWSLPGHEFRLLVRVERARLYDIVVREGRPEDFLHCIRGALFADLRSEMVVPRDVRAA